MGQKTYLTDNFYREEFACKDYCGFDNISLKLVVVLQAVRSFIGRKMQVRSGCRCEAHNRGEGGIKDSRHIYGDAADVRVEGVDPFMLAGIFYALHIEGQIDIKRLIPKRAGNYLHVALQGSKDAKSEYFAGFPKGEE
ncbi:hypothetical protein LCGC14_2452340 [marine sediment metagenome]|uniref:Peptidase M15A C-terminal domain-containing protein n=1 Tax=marine sediment metagenome TaxID=412755 RepID=A0A0F9BG74_9ZZZZ